VHRFILAVLGLLAAGLGVAEVVTHQRTIAEDDVSNRPVQRGGGGFTSSDTCRACHPGEYASWHASYHRTMTQVASPETAIPSFAEQTVTSTQGRPMVLRQRQSALFAEFDDPDAGTGAAGPARIERQVTMITGSHNQQVFWYDTGLGRLLGQLPAAYLVQERRWIPRRMAVLHPPSQLPRSESGHWNSTCIACHATNGTPRFDTPFGSQPVTSQSAQTTVTEFGIACESCHGPAEAHVRGNRNPLRRYGLHLSGAADALTVQPARLPPALTSQVCGQCHGVWEFYDAEGERRANADGLPFRPGDELTATRFVAQPTRNAASETMQALLADDSRFIRDAFWADGTVRVSGREYNGLLESPCYRLATEPKRTLTCLSCHSLHQEANDPRPVAAWADDQLRWFAAAPRHEEPDPQTSNAACLQCHEPLRANTSAHTHHAVGSTGSVCYNCHMPYTTYGLLKTIRSHTIGSPTVQESVGVGRPNACNLCHLDRTLAWTGEALARWYGTAPVPLGDEEHTVAASLQWLLKGDAGQRAIATQAMAWTPAQRASGTEWMAPYLAQLLDDPYDAVRLGAARVLRTLPGFATTEIDVAEAPPVRRDAQRRVMATWDRVRPRPGRAAAELLMTPAGELDVPRVRSMLRQRNNRAMLLRE